jgi:hypothetical protein
MPKVSAGFMNFIIRQRQGLTVCTKNFGCYNFAYRKDTKALVIGYRTKWPTGWTSEWFYVKADEKKRDKLMSMVMCPLRLNFVMTRPLCNMQLGSPCELAEVEFRVVVEHISTRDFVQEYLANWTFPTSGGWGMPKKKEEGKKYELVLSYHFKFQKRFKEPCTEWLELIETMCNEIPRNYTKKEDQLLTAAFGTRPKRRLNHVMDALNFEYPDYKRLDEGDRGVKRKRIVSILSKQVVRSVKEDQEDLKKRKIVPEPKVSSPKKRKLVEMSSEKAKLENVLKQTASPSSSGAEVSDILKVMTESFPFALLSPLRLEPTSLLQTREISSVVEGRDRGQKKRRMMNILEAIEQTPPSASADKAAKSTDAEGTIAAEDENLTATLSEIDRLISDVVAEKEVGAVVFDKGKKIEETSSEGVNFDLRHLGGQQLFEEDISELKEFAISCGYQSRSMLFDGVDEEIMGCIRDRICAKIISMSKSIGFPKLEKDISCYRCQHIIGNLFYSNFKVRSLCELSLISSC